MGFDKISRFFGMNDEDFNDLSTQETQQPVQQPTKHAPKAQSQPSRPMPEAPKLRATVQNQANNVVSMNTMKNNQTSKIILFEPRVYSDAKEIGTHLLNGRAVIVNFTRIDETQAKRIIDFLTGTIFAVKGEIQRVGDRIFLCTPAKFEVDGSISDIIRDTKFN